MAAMTCLAGAGREPGAALAAGVDDGAGPEHDGVERVSAADRGRLRGDAVGVTTPLPVASTPHHHHKDTCKTKT